jgi:hypothetical protein
MENAEETGDEKMTRVIWHYHEMGNQHEANMLKPVFDGITRDEALLKEMYRLASIEFDGIAKVILEHGYEWDDSPSYKKLNELYKIFFTPEYIQEHYPNKDFLCNEEAIYYLTAHIGGMAQNNCCGPLYADEITEDEQSWYVMITRDERVFVSPAEGGCYDTVSHFVKWTCFDTKEKALNFVRAYNLEAMKKRMDGDYSLLGDDDTVSSIYPEGYIPTGWVAESSCLARLVILPFVPEREPWRYE